MKQRPLPWFRGTLAPGATIKENTIIRGFCFLHRASVFVVERVSSYLSGYYEYSCCVLCHVVVQGKKKKKKLEVKPGCHKLWGYGNTERSFCSWYYYQIVAAGRKEVLTDGIYIHIAGLQALYI